MRVVGLFPVFSLTRFERLIEYIASKDGVWFATCAEICDAWVDDDEDRRLMEAEDVRGVAEAPVGSGFR